jgi:GH15 family glucan-1,4-alpha-glucosidase
MLVTFDDKYQLRDFYFPHVGQDNHAGAGPCHFGVWAETPGPKKEGEASGQLAWTSDEGFQRRLRYLDDALTTDVDLWHDDLGLSLHCGDAVDFNRNVLVRRIKVHNRLDTGRLVKVFHHNDFLMFGTRVGDTAYYDPELKSMVHYRGKRYLSATFFEEHGNGGENPVSQRVDEFATGTSGFGGAEGTYRDAEDGKLGMNPISQGAVDSTMSINVHLAPGETRTLYMAIIAGKSRDEIVELHRWLTKQTPAQVIKRTTGYWRLWSQGAGIQFGDLSENVEKCFKRSLLTVRTQIDNEGAILAANDSDIMQFARDTYSYMWPRDGALVADSLDLCGFHDLARGFYSFCQRVIQPEGYFLHKYNPDGSPASSWHPWIKDGKPSLPIQEDETALVVWSLWRHYWRYRDTEYVRPLWIDVVIPAADFMCKYRDGQTGLPLPSYDLWEERWGIHAFTVATVYGGLIAARNFAISFGDNERAERYGNAAAEIQEAAARYLWSDKLGRFSRRLVPLDQPSPPQEPGYQEPDELREKPDCDGLFEVDDTIDASLFAIYKFHLFAGDDPRVKATMQAVEDELWVKTDVGGVARYTNDYYHRVSDDIDKVPGNPWFICTLWLADYKIHTATTKGELAAAHPIFEWTADHALESGVLAEQVNPYTNEPISVSPLTWSHATVCSTVVKYLEKLEQLDRANAGPETFKMRVPGRFQSSHSTDVPDAPGADYSDPTSVPAPPPKPEPQADDARAA